MSPPSWASLPPPTPIPHVYTITERGAALPVLSNHKFPQAVCFIVVTHVSTEGWDGAGVGGRSKSEGTRG